MFVNNIYCDKIGVQGDRQVPILHGEMLILTTIFDGHVGSVICSDCLAGSDRLDFHSVQIFV